MLKVKESTIENKVISYSVVNGTNAISLKDMPTGTEFYVDNYILTEITREDTGEVFESILLFDSKSSQAYGTRSETVIKFIKGLVELDNGQSLKEGITLRKTVGTAKKSGHQYIGVSIVL